MQVTIIGSGNVGTVLGRLLFQHGHIIRQVYSRREAHALELATQVNAEAVTDLASIDQGADVYLIAVSDDALPDIAAGISFGSKLVIHTAGSVSKEILKTVSTNYGVLWPMKMIRKTMATIAPVTIVIDGNSAMMLDQLESIAKQLSDTITIADDELRVKMHMLAAVTSNFSNHLYNLAAGYCEKEGIDFSHFYPIIEETAKQVQFNHPAKLQAGPAFRKDLQTLEKHRNLLNQYPDLKELYEVLSYSILKHPSA